jgi:hypothetical protein
MILEVCGGLDLYQTPSSVSTPLQDVHADEYVAVFERALENRWNFSICY